MYQSMFLKYESVCMYQSMFQSMNAYMCMYQWILMIKTELETKH